MEANKSKDTAWSKFEEYAKQRVVGGATGLPGSRNPISPTVMKLHKEDMAIYGREPATDNIILVVCELCGRVVKSQALLKHKELYHSDVLRTPLPPLTRKPTSDYVAPVQTYGQSTSMGLGTTGSTKKNKECDYDRHCGVWIEADKRYCRKSITCKIHPLEMRQKVTGRSRPFSELLREHKNRKKQKKNEKIRLASSNPILPSSSHGVNNSSHFVTSPNATSPLSPSPPPPPSLPSSIDRSPLPSSALVYLGEYDDEMVEANTGTLSVTGDDPLSEQQLYPKPLAVNAFHSRQMTQGYSSFSHRFDSLRSVLISLTEREKEFRHIPQESLRQRHAQKKYSYLGRQNHILLSHSNHKPSPSTSITLDPASFQTPPLQAPPQQDPPPLIHSSTSSLLSHNDIPITSRESHPPLPPPPSITRNSRKRGHSTSNNDHYFNSYDSKRRNIGGWEEDDENGDMMNDFSSSKRRHSLKIKCENTDSSTQQHLMKLGSPSVNGLAGSPHAPSSSQTFVINPSHHFLPRTILPISGYDGVHNQLNSSTVTPDTVPPDNHHHHHNMLHQMIPPHHLPEGGGGRWMNQSTVGGYDTANNSIMYPGDMTTSGAHYNDHVTNAMHSSGSPHINKFYLPPLQSGSPLAVHQMSASGSLVQPGADGSLGVGGSRGGKGVSKSSPPRLHRLTTPSASNQTSYSHQTGLTASQNVTQRTQQVS